MSDDDFEPFVGGPPPDPSERTWRHPSELAAQAHADAMAAHRGPVRGTRVWTGLRRPGPRPLNLLVAGSLGAAACIAAVAVIGAQDSGFGSTGVALAPTGAVEITPLDGNDPSTGAVSGDATATIPAASGPANTTASDSPESTTPASAAEQTTIASAGVLAAAQRHVVGVWVDGEFVSTGVLIDGYVLTSASAIGDQLSVTVSSDTDAALAYLVGTDPFSDLAVYRPSIDSRRPDALVAISLRLLAADPSAPATPAAVSFDASSTSKDPTDLEEGEAVVLAVATPEGFRTHDGLVLAVDQGSETADGHPLVGLIDTSLRRTSDAAGGLLISSDGVPVGIVIGNSSSLASAVPLEDARRIAGHLIEDGWASETWIGFIGLDRDRGVEVVDVSPGGPAETAGLIPGDVIAFFDGARVNDMGGVTAGLRRAEPGDAIVLVVERDGAFTALRVIAEEYVAQRVSEPVGG